MNTLPIFRGYSRQLFTTIAYHFYEPALLYMPLPQWILSPYFELLSVTLDHYHRLLRLASIFIETYTITSNARYRQLVNTIMLKVKNYHRSKFSNLSNWKEEAWKRSGLQRKFTAMTILHSHLQPQFKNELFHIFHIIICFVKIGFEKRRTNTK